MIALVLTATLIGCITLALAVKDFIVERKRESILARVRDWEAVHPLKSSHLVNFRRGM